MSKNEAKTAFLTSVVEAPTSKIKMPPCLVLLAGADQHTGRQWILQKSQVTLGRIAPADIQIEAASLSKAHARFDVDGDSITVTDLGSTNKTFLNDEVLAPNKPYPLKNNDRLRAGGLIFKFLQKGILSETHEKARMESELVSASKIQASALPAQLEARYQSVQIGGRYRTATECGGDWWWHWSKGDRAFAIIADATGHGAGAAMLTSAARSAIAALEGDATTDIEKVYLTLTRALKSVAQGNLTMSAFLVEVDFKLKRLRYINASHPFPVLLNKPIAAGTQWRNLKFLNEGISQSLGGASEQHTIASQPLQPGTRLVLLTDGLIDRKKDEKLIASERAFYSALIGVHNQNVDDQGGFLDQLLAKSDELAESVPQDDDITVVALDFF